MGSMHTCCTHQHHLSSDAEEVLDVRCCAEALSHSSFLTSLGVTLSVQTNIILCPSNWVFSQNLQEMGTNFWFKPKELDCGRVSQVLFLRDIFFFFFEISWTFLASVSWSSFRCWFPALFFSQLCHNPCCIY